MDYAAVIELIGFDIILLGLLTLLACYIGRQLWSNKGATCLYAFRKGWANYTKYLQGCLDSPGPADDCSDKTASRTARASQMIGVLLMAGLFGMVINIIGDRMLDSDLIRFLPVPPIWVKADAGQLKLSRWPCEGWQPEDAIKTDALKAVSSLYLEADNAAFKAGHLIPGKSTETKTVCSWSEKSYESQEAHAKEFFQHAYAWALASKNEQVLSALRYEYLVIKVLRTLFAISTFLLLIALCGRWRKTLWDTGRNGIWGELKNPRSIIGVLILLLSPFLFLTLWSTQSKRYDKKVFHAYLVLADNKDAVLHYPAQAQPSPAPSSSPSRTSASVAGR